MTPAELRAQVALGEDSRRQFKRDVTSADSLAAEMAAFANSEGGTLYLGVADDRSLPGLSRADVARLNQLIGNAASQHVRSPLTVQTENLGVDDERVVIVLTVPRGLDKPYFDRNGVIWLKSGADKRRVNSKEKLSRLFQSVDRFHFDDRIEIVSPGHLPNNLTVAKIRTGNSNIRNPILVSYIAKGLLPYRGLGSGIKRALENWPEIDFTDDRDGCLFTATVHRTEAPSSVRSPQEGDRIASTMEGTTEVTTEVARVLACLERPLTRKELQTALGLRNAEHFRKAYLVPALAAGVIEMTHAEKPRSSRQSYRRTAPGRAWVESQGGRP